MDTRAVRRRGAARMDPSGSGTLSNERPSAAPAPHQLDTGALRTHDAEETLRQLREEGEFLRLQVSIREEQRRNASLREHLSADHTPEATAPEPSEGESSFQTPSTADTGSVHRDTDAEWAGTLRARPPPMYKGKNIKEHADFVYACEAAFRFAGKLNAPDERKVSYAMTHVEGEPRDRWAARCKEVDPATVTWEEFSNFLLDLIQDPVNRGMTTAQRYYDAQQKTGQSVNAFVSYVEQLEAEMEPFSDVHRRQHLLAKLRPELRKAITNHQNVPDNRSALISLAARLEDNMRSPQAAQEANSRREHSGALRRDRTRSLSRAREREQAATRLPWRGRGPPRHSRATPQVERRSSDNIANVTCYACGEKGHYASACTNRQISQREPKNTQTRR